MIRDLASVAISGRYGPNATDTSELSVVGGQRAR